MDIPLSKEIIMIVSLATSMAEDQGTVSPIGFDFFNYADPANFVLLMGFVIPLLTGVVTKKVAHPGVKAVVTLALSALTGALAVIVSPSGDWAVRDFGNAFLSAFLPAIASYYGLWKPTGIAGAVQDKTSSVGVVIKPDTSPAPVVVSPTEVIATNDSGEVVATVNDNEGTLVADGALPVPERDFIDVDGDGFPDGRHRSGRTA